MSEKTQSYIGVPNAVIWCVDDLYENNMKGRMYCSYYTEPIMIDSIAELLRRMDKLYNDLNFPFPGNNERHYTKRRGSTVKEELEKVVEDEELLTRHGDLGTFIIRVQHRQHSSWQGRITWVEEDKTLYFRSALEMMKLIEEAMATVQQPEDEDKQTW